MEFLAHLTGSINGFAAYGALAAFVEIVLRLIPTQKPLSIAYAAEDFIHGVADLAKAVGDALDRVLPQRVKAPASAPAQQ